MVPLWRNRWFWVAAALACSHAGWGAWWWKGHRGRAPTRVVRVFPEELPAPDGLLTAVFSRPMVPSSEIGAVRELPEISVTPAAPVSCVWRSPTTLEIHPSAPLPLATPYRLTISRRLLDAQGSPIEKEVEHRFRTAPLRLVSMTQLGMSRDWAATISLTFNDAVPIGDLDAKARFVDEEGKPVPVTRRTRESTSRSAIFETDARRRERVEVQLEAGLRGVAGPLGLEVDTRQSLTLEAGVRLQEATPRMQDAGDGFIDLRFGLGIEPDVAKSFLKVDPPVRYALERIDGGLRLRGAFQASAAYRLELAPGLPAEGGRFLADRVLRNVRMPELRPSIHFVGEGRFLEAGRSQTLVLRTVNAPRVILGAAEVFPHNLVHYLHNSSHVGRRLLGEKVLEIDGPRNQPIFTRLDLRETLPAVPNGPLLLTARAPDSYWTRASRHVTVTRLGIHAKLAPGCLLVWVLHLDDVSPAGGANVTVLSRSNRELYRGTTDENGLARFEGPPSGREPQPGQPEEDEEERGDEEAPFAITVAAGEDFSYLPLEHAGLTLSGLDTGGRPYPGPAGEAYVYPERGVMRPGEAIHLRALVRLGGGELPPGGLPVEWEVLRPDGRSAAVSSASLSSWGTAEMRWQSSRDLPTGSYRARLRLPGSGGQAARTSGGSLGEASFRVEEFLPETLRVELSAEERRFAGGESLKVKVRAEHLFGGPAAGLAVESRCELLPASFTHADWPEAAFSSSTGELIERRLEGAPAVLDERGEADIAFSIPAELRAASALQAAVTATVIQVGGRGSTARMLRAVDPLPFYLGTRCPAGHARLGERFEIEAIAVRPDGQAAGVRVLSAKLSRVSWSHALKKDPASGNYRWQSERREEPIRSEEITLENGRGIFAFTPELAGEHVLALTASRGDRETPVTAAAAFHVAGAGGPDGGGSLEVPARIALVPDREHYRAGETARVRVESPIAGTALLTLETDRVHSARTFLLPGSTTTLDVPVSGGLDPHGYLTLTVVRPGLSPGSAGLPLRAYGAVALRRDPSERAAGVTLEAPAEVRPGAELALRLSVLGSDGCPDDAEVAVAVVDAGILALTRFETPDPLRFFLAQRALGTRAADVYSLVIPEPGDLLTLAASRPGGGDDMAALLNPIVSNRVRSVSQWLGGLKTDSDGRLAVSIPAPDFDGELAVMAVAAGKSGLGSARAAVLVRRPLVAEPSLPRFLAPGDRAHVPLALHNTTTSLREAVVTLSAAGQARLTPGERDAEAVEVPAGGRATIWFELEALEPGPATVTFHVSSAGEEFVKSTELPVRPAAPPVSETSSKLLAGGGEIRIAPTAQMLPGTARAELVVSASILPALEGSLRYLLHYPYGCIEQTTSSLIPWIALKDYLDAGGAEERSADEVWDHVEAGVARLFSMQTPDGGLSYWPGGSSSYHFGSVHAAWALLEARASGHTLPARAFERLLDYLETLLAGPHEGEADSAAPLRAYALEVLARAGRARRAWIETLYERREELGDEGRAHLAIAARAARLTLPGPLLDLSAAAGDDPPEPVRDLSGFLYSKPRELCFVLSAMVDLGEPREKILPLFAKLTGLSTRGRYRSTLEDGLYVLAVSKLARLFPPHRGESRAELTLPGGERRAVPLDGRRALRLGAGELPSLLKAASEADLFAFVEVRGVPVSGAAEEDKGLIARRTFLLPDGKPRPNAPFRQGEAFLVQIRLQAPRSLSNVAVVDPLPAGFEIENPSLATSDGRQESSGALQLVRSEVRDDRLILFANLGQGESRHRYAARAVARGRFALPPLSAECMYDSEIRSVHGGGAVQVIP